MTMMVRDEADVIEAMVTHHFAQGVDTILVTDNGSVDGTAEILERLADSHDIVLMHDPVHAKQQSKCVTRMANQAYTDYRADWVINADADEFWVPRSHETLHQAFETYPKRYEAFQVHVEDMTGLPAAQGTGLGRLIYRDLRPTTMLRGVGLRDHSTPDAVHVGADGIEVVQGNHAVSLASKGAPDPDQSVEVLHFPWRSWEQFRRKVENAGSAYESNPTLKPSPNHHGMRDYKLLKSGKLLASYLLRSLTEAQLAEGIDAGIYAQETRIRDEDLPQVEDSPLEFDPVEMVGQLRDLAAAQGQRLAEVAASADQQIADARARVEALRQEWEQERDELHATEVRLHQRVEAASDQLTAARIELQNLRNRPYVKVARSASRLLHRS